MASDERVNFESELNSVEAEIDAGIPASELDKRLRSVLRELKQVDIAEEGEVRERTNELLFEFSDVDNEEVFEYCQSRR